MALAVVTPCCYSGGLDVVASCLSQQAVGEIFWMVLDDRDDREGDVEELAHRSGVTLVYIRTSHLRDEKVGGPWTRTLARGMNEALEAARKLSVELLVTYQDYIWIPPDGISRFQAASKKLPNALLTGICDHSETPTPEAVVNPNGRITVFEKPWSRDDRPEGRSWSDPRFEQLQDAGLEHDLQNVTPAWWEANWGAIPKSLLDAEIEFSPEYDKGVAFENSDFAFKCAVRGYETWLDPDNKAISLPHKRYFPKLEARDVKKLNTKMHHEKWALELPPDA